MITLDLLVETVCITSAHVPGWESVGVCMPCVSVGVFSLAQQMSLPDASLIVAYAVLYLHSFESLLRSVRNSNGCLQYRSRRYPTQDNTKPPSKTVQRRQRRATNHRRRPRLQKQVEQLITHAKHNNDDSRLFAINISNCLKRASRVRKLFEGMERAPSMGRLYTAIMSHELEKASWRDGTCQRRYARCIQDLPL